MSADEAQRATMLDVLRRGPAPLQALAAALARAHGAAEGGWGVPAGHHLDRLAMDGQVAGPDRLWCYRLAEGSRTT